jgi:hypothetical protein
VNRPCVRRGLRRGLDPSSPRLVHAPVSHLSTPALSTNPRLSTPCPHHRPHLVHTCPRVLRHGCRGQRGRRPVMTPSNATYTCPDAPIISVSEEQSWRRVILIAAIRCPHCGRVHVHVVDPRGTPVLGHRLSHCLPSDRDTYELRSYTLTDPDRLSHERGGGGVPGGVARRLRTGGRRSLRRR